MPRLNFASGASFLRSPFRIFRRNTGIFLFLPLRTETVVILYDVALRDVKRRITRRLAYRTVRREHKEKEQDGGK